MYEWKIAQDIVNPNDMIMQHRRVCYSGCDASYKLWVCWLYLENPSERS